jgi:predicted deacetylase
MCNVNRTEYPGTVAARREFIVVVHDACPVHSDEIQEVVSALEPLVGRTIAAAVVPSWHRSGFDAENCFAEWVTRHFGEILLHGWTHQRDEAGSRIQLGQNHLTNIFGAQAAGFVAPAWQRGRIERKTLGLHGLEFLLGYLAIECVDGRRVPVSTVTWDVGRFGRLGYAAALIGHALAWGRGRSIRCLAAHPADVSRGYLPRIIRTVESWMRSGRTPILPSELLRSADGDSAS